MTWYHVVYTRTGNVFRTYLNGVQQGSDVSNAKNLESAASSYSYRIGCAGDYGSEGQFYNGDLDEFAFYDYALSSNAILEHYQCGTTAFTVTPQSGPFAGGNSLLITNCVPAIGNGSDITNVLVGGVSAGVPTAQGTNWVTFVAPVTGSAGVKDIVIQSTLLGNTTLTGAYTYNPAGTIFGYGPDGWQEVASLPIGLSDFGAAALNGAIFAAGGNVGGSSLTNTYKFDGTSWTEVSGMPIGFCAQAMGVLNGYAYSIGGTLSGSANGETNVLRFDGTNWQAVAGLPSGRRHLAAATLGNYLYAIGGYGGGQSGNTNVYRFNGTNWSQVCGLPATRNALFAGTLNGYIYAMGGYNSSWTAQTNVYRFDGSNWTEVVGLPQARTLSAVATRENHLYVMGNDSGDPKSAIRFDSTNWTSIDDLPGNTAYRPAGAMLNNRVYCMGGDSSSGSNVYAYGQTLTSGVLPTSGSWTGGYLVVITGTNLCDGTMGDVTNVTLCGVAATVTNVAGSTRIVVTAAAGTPDLGDVRVFSTSFGEVVKSNAFSYNPAITAGAGPHGAVAPSGVVDVAYGGSTSFVATADQYYHIGSLTTNGVSVGEATNQPVYTSVWVNVMATGTLVAAFAENLTTNTGTPEWWLAQYGLTNNFNAAATNDADGDGMPAWAEFHADTDPTNRSSVLTIVGIYQTNGEMRIEWKGGTNAWQILEIRKDLVSTIEQWLAICTNLPPTPVTTNYLHDVTTNGVMFYRIKARRE